MKKLDYGMLILFLVALFIIFFFWKCDFDPIVTVIAVIIAVVTGLATHMQYKKLKELGEDEENQNK